MKFEFYCCEELPKLAWGLRVESGSDVIRVAHGEWVEVGDLFFVEGAWDGEFREGRVEEAESLMGSGAVIKQDQLVICPPAHITEAIYSIRGSECIWFSNSLPFVLEAANEKLRFDYLDYESDFLRIADGLKKYKRDIPLQSNNKLNIHLYYNLLVTKDLKISEQKKPLSADFSTFEEYKIFLIDTLKKIEANARDSARKKTYRPIVFCSKGYDSVACAAIGKDIGCDEAVVFESKRSSRSDSGKEVVEQLGYSIIHEKEELQYMACSIAEDFVASGELGTSIFFAAAEKELTGSLLLSGVHGDRVWDKHLSCEDDELIRSFYPDSAKKEFRLRAGYIPVAIPFIGALKESNFYAISNSQAMKKWSVGGDYDRPIARRFAEEKGVRREAFGFMKSGGAGSSLRFLHLEYLKKVMPPGSFADFEQFYKRTKSKRKKSLQYGFRSLVYFIYCITHLAEMKKIPLQKILKIDRWSLKLKCSPWAPSFLFLWGINKLSTKYQKGAARLKI
ncbi:hypothetical protein [Jeotgalibacillus proteolyticus]|uniref:Asparagine synthetase domain-containing protein n=1 Tax=Jeotgalibacillus proteolyticus TaxID=2082395 RepID=A0A2S5GBL8_9BACL|nr:hypothetical protein [Jeotgalibacillus proteolyticus]PPA70396.1 hypothetical protein C4B60_12540 [Jeotgalibacillus proteolyticus]